MPRCCAGGQGPQQQREAGHLLCSLFSSRWQHGPEPARLLSGGPEGQGHRLSVQPWGSVLLAWACRLHLSCAEALSRSETGEDNLPCSSHPSYGGFPPCPQKLRVCACTGVLMRVTEPWLYQHPPYLWLAGGILHAPLL